MTIPFQIGESKQIRHQVTEADTATFITGNVHPVYATFAVAREAEWACRQFVLEMRESDEEGIGTFVTVEHRSPALIGQEVVFKATLESITGNHVICNYEARVGERLVASGRQGQKILKKERISQLFDSLR